MKKSKDGSKARQKRRRQRRPDEVRARILEAALRRFAERGFDGAVMQDIAKESGIGLSLVVYHFKSKKNLWRATVGAVAERFHSPIQEMASATDLSATEKLRLLVANLVRLGVQSPEFTRIAAMEAYQKSDRLLWLVRFGQRSFEALLSLIGEAQREGGVRPNLSPDRLRYAILGITSIPSMAAEFRQLTGRDSTSSEEIEASIDFINKLVFTDA